MIRLTLRTIAATLAAVLALAACSSSGGGASTTSSGALKVVTAFYPVAEAVEQVGGAHVAVTNLTPAGAEPHDLELTTRDVDAIQDAALVVVMGHGFQPAVEKAATQRDHGTLALLDTLPIGAGSKRVKEGDPNALDPHVWLDPALMTKLVGSVASTLEKTDPKHRADYERNAAVFTKRLAVLDSDYAKGLAHCARKEIVTAHEAFGYLARHYGLKQEGIAGIAPDQEPNAQRLADLADLVRRDHITVIFTEELVSPRVANRACPRGGWTAHRDAQPFGGPLRPGDCQR